jgi:pilus assembly protein CpaC
VPLIGDIPILNNLLGFQQMQSGEQELVILVTPELVHPLNPDEVPPQPGSDLFEPSDLEFYVLGRLESLRNYDYRAPVRNSLERMKSYKRMEDLYIFGPSGYSEDQHAPHH